MPEAEQVQMRPQRFRDLTGVPLDDETMIGYLDRLGFQPKPEGDLITTTVPHHRGDISREVDLIEEVVRMHGFDDIDMPDVMRMRPAAMPASLACQRAISRLLVGADFVESVTHTLVSEREGSAFLNDQETMMRVEASCAGGDACLRPSVLASLLRVRKFNLDQGTASLRLFEWGSTFNSLDGARSEKRSLALLCDADQDGLRPLRGVLERLANLLCGPAARLDIDPEQAPGWFAPGGTVRIDNTPVGWAGRLSGKTLKAFGLDQPIMAAEISIDDLMAGWPPDIEVHALPAYPAIERDLSVILEETTRWHAIQEGIESLDLPFMESVDFVTTYRGKGIESGHKSLTLRIRFRDPERTLRNEEVDDSMPKVMDLLKTRFNGEIRG